MKISRFPLFCSKALLPLLISACGPFQGSPLLISLTPIPPSAPTKISQGTQVHLAVVDDRPIKLVGNLDFGPRGRGIATAQPIDELFHELLRKGLSGLGYEVIDGPESSAKRLEVKIRTFELWRAYNMNFDATVVASVFQRNYQLLSKTYTINTANHAFVTGSWITDKLNGSISDLLHRILGDLELLAALQ